MLRIKNYVKAKSLEEAYELNQKRSARILGGMVWMKMGNRNINTAIDLSGLGLDEISETDEEFVIGCMVSLHQLEMNDSLNRMTHGAVRDSLRHIVGVQFRNCATVGGSIYGRFGFSDVLTMFLSLDSYVELYHAGRIALKEFVNRKKDRDILVNVIVKKENMRCAYESFRNSSTDFPVLAVSVCLSEQGVRTAVGARPGRAVLLGDEKGLLTHYPEMTLDEKKMAEEQYGAFVRETVSFGGNMRASKEYREYLSAVLVKRALKTAGGTGNGH